MIVEVKLSLRGEKDLEMSHCVNEYASVEQFVAVKTPDAWLEAAGKHIDILLIDHAHCEKKAASTAMNLLFRYVDRAELLRKLSQLAREELLHFEQVLDLMDERQVTYQHLEPSRYAKGLRTHVRTYEPDKLIDTLIIGAFIEARSCERFAALAESGLVDDGLAKYYRFLLKSESRHFVDYLALAETYTDPAELDTFQERIQFFRDVEAQLIVEPDAQFRFHSGPPIEDSGFNK